MRAHRIRTVIVELGACLGLMAAPAAALADAVSDAAAAYEAGRCADVLAAFGGLSAAETDALDGVSLYRWGFCAGAMRQGDAFAYYRRAAEKLQTEAASPYAPLDVHFYRVNALLNLDLAADARAAAALAVERWNAGTLTVPQEDPTAWFRLGKLHYDAGDIAGSMVPFGRALDLAEENPGSLRSAYLERIANYAQQAGDEKTMARANDLLLGSPGTASGESPAQRARALVRAGRYAEARDLLEPLTRDRGDLGMTAQYTIGALDRAGEVLARGAQLDPRASSAEGSETYPGSMSLEAALVTTGQEAWAAIGSGRVVEAPRKNRALPGTRPVASRTTIEQLTPIEARFAGLLLDAVGSGAPLREWAVQGGFAPLVLQPWERLVVERDSTVRQGQLIDLQ